MPPRVCSNVLAGVLLSACHVVLPLGPGADAPPGPDAAVDVVATDRDRPDALAPDAPPRDAPAVDAAAPDAPAIDVLLSDKPSPPDVGTPVAEGGVCADPASWDCPSFASFYCVATCGTKQINCGTTQCTCAGDPAPCYQPTIGYCAACMNAVAAGCCQ